MTKTYLSVTVRGTTMIYTLFILLALSVNGYALSQPAPDNLDDVNQKFEKEYAAKKLRAEQGDAQAQYEWGIDCIYRQKGTPADGLHWLLLSAAQGNVEAEAQAGICYAQGLGAEKNPEESLRLLRNAATKGNHYALMELGILSMEGFGPLPKDLEQAEKYLSNAADKGNAAAKKYLEIVRDSLKKDRAPQAGEKSSP